MTSLQETCEGVLQYLEAAAHGEVSAEAPLVLPSIRCLGRCAQECLSYVGVGCLKSLQADCCCLKTIHLLLQLSCVLYHVAHVTL